MSCAARRSSSQQRHARHRSSRTGFMGAQVRGPLAPVALMWRSGAGRSRTGPRRRSARNCSASVNSEPSVTWSVKPAATVLGRLARQKRPSERIAVPSSSRCRLGQPPQQTGRNEQREQAGSTVGSKSARQDRSGKLSVPSPGRTPGIDVVPALTPGAGAQRRRSAGPFGVVAGVDRTPQGADAGDQLRAGTRSPGPPCLPMLRIGPVSAPDHFSLKVISSGLHVIFKVWPLVTSTTCCRPVMSFEGEDWIRNSSAAPPRKAGKQVRDGSAGSSSR